MKLKYYMRGLGIGIVLTTLIFTIGGPKEKLSDNEIIKRAEALGMVKEDKSNSSLDKAMDDMNLTVTPSVTPAAKSTEAPTAKPEKTSKMKDTKNTQDSQKNAGITFDIYEGMSSNKVSKLLVKKGLIEDATDFNRYMVRLGKVGVIRGGRYTIPKGSTYDEIIQKITSNKDK